MIIEGLVIFVCLISVFLFKAWLISYKYNKQYQCSIESFLKKRESQIQLITEIVHNAKISQDKKNLILNSNLNELRGLLLEKKVTCREILLIYAEKSITLGKDLKLIADVSAFFTALERADQYEFSLTQEKKDLPLLYGIPFSVKEQINLQNSMTTCGYANLLLNRGPSSSDALIIQALRKNGAIPFISSNVPQGLFCIDSVNSIYGAAINPLNPKRIVGGSSGGAAGMVVGNCSPFSIASDSAGSIRIPSAFCGVFGFKPTPRRISIKGRIGVGGVEDPMRDNPPTIGPIGKCVEDLVMIMRCIYGEFEADPETIPLKFQENLYQEVLMKENKALKIGFIETNEFFESCQGVKNIVNEVCQSLKNQGHFVKKFEINDAEKIFECILGTSGNVLGKTLEKTLNHEKPLDFNKRTILLTKIPNFIKKIIAFFLKLKGELRLEKLLRISTTKNEKEVLQYINQKENLKKNFFNYWIKEDFDALITPAFPIPAPKLNQNNNLLIGVLYNIIANAYEMPCGTIPVRGITKNETENYMDKYDDTFTKFIRENLQNSEGMPLAINVICKPYLDEKCLGIMKIIENAIKKN